MTKKLQNKIDKEIIKLSKMEKNYIKQTEEMVWELKKQRLKCEELLNKMNEELK